MMNPQRIIQQSCSSSILSFFELTVSVCNRFVQHKASCSPFLVLTEQKQDKQMIKYSVISPKNDKQLQDL